MWNNSVAMHILAELSKQTFCKLCVLSAAAPSK
jgi:hypothetical protein